MAFCRYIFGKNETGEKMKMTTPVYTEMADSGPISEGNIQVVLPLKSKLAE
jgi:hypothetical protein